jgi:hypothetical protein
MRLRHGKSLCGRSFFRWLRRPRNIHGPDLSDAYRRSATRTKTGSFRHFRSAIFTGQDRHPPGQLPGKLPADSWLGKKNREVS